MKDDLKVALILRGQKELVNLIEEVEKGKLDVICVYSREILCQDVEIRQRIIDYLNSLGVKVVFATENFEEKKNDPEKTEASS